MSQQTASPAMRWARRLFIAFVVAAGIVTFLPQLVALSPLRHELPKTTLRGFEGKTRVGSASLSWWGSIELDDMELFAPDDKPFIHIKRYVEKRTVFTLLFRKGAPADLHVTEPVVTLVLRPDGSNVEDALAPVIAYRRQHPSHSKERSVEVVDGVMNVQEAGKDKVRSWRDIGLHLHVSPDGSAPNELDVTARLDGATGAEPLEAAFSWPAEGQATDRTLSLKTANLPLDSMEPLLHRSIPDLELTGALTIDCNTSLSRSAAGGSAPFRVDGQLAVRELAVASASRLGSDLVVVDQLDVRGKLSSNGAACRVETLDLASDFGRVTSSGTIPLRSDDGDGEDFASRLSDADFDLKGEIDLVRIVNLLPETLRLREGTKLTEGTVRVDLSTRAGDKGPRWKGKIETTRLAAQVGNDHVTWDQPIEWTFDVHRAADRFHIDALDCRSDFAQLKGQGDSEAAQISGHVDLDKLAAQLGRFIDLKDSRLQGQAKLIVDLKRAPDGALELAGETTISGFAAGSHDQGPAVQPPFVVTLESRSTDKEHGHEVSSLTLKIATKAEGDSLVATLAEPVKLPDLASKSNWNLKLDGDLEQWSARLPAEHLAGTRVAGTIRSTAKLRLSADEYALYDLIADVKELRWIGHGVDFTEPNAHVKGAARWNRAGRKLTIPALDVEGAIGSASGRDIVLASSTEGLPAIAGQFEFRSDLDRINPPDTAEAERPFAGRVRAQLAFSQEGSRSEGRFEVDVEDLTIRRQTTKQVERRRGDIEKIEPGRPTVQVPRVPAGTPVDRNTRRAIERAEREYEKEAKQLEREARKRADETVFVPVSEWKTLWNDPKFVLKGAARIDRQQDRIELTNLDVATDGIHVTASGQVSEASRRAVIDLHGESDYDLERLLARLQGLIGNRVRVSGKERHKFSLSGPLFEPTGSDRQHGHSEHPLALVPLELKGEAAAGWQKGDLFGLQAGAGVIDVRLAQGILAMQPLEMPLSGGQLRLAPRVLLTGQPVRVVLPAGPLVRDVQLSQEVCDAWLKYSAPILSEATRVEGKFSVDLNEATLPLSDPASGNLSGRLDIESAQVMPGPLFNEIGEFVAQIEQVARLGQPGSLLGLDKPLARIDKQKVEFKLQDRRLYSSPMTFSIRNIAVRTRGSVGVDDESLDMIAEIALPTEWTRRVSFLARMQGKPLEIPIRGTLRNPKLDGSGIGRAWEQFGIDALDGLLNGGLQKLFDR